MPLIRGYILAAVLGPHVGLNVIHDEESIELIAEIGLVLLLFLIGLEINLPRLRQAGRTLTVNGVLKVPLCAGVAWFALASVAEATSSPFDRPAVSATSSSPCSSSPWVSAFPPVHGSPAPGRRGVRLRDPGAVRGDVSRVRPAAPRPAHGHPGRHQSRADQRVLAGRLHAGGRLRPREREGGCAGALHADPDLGGVHLRNPLQPVPGRPDHSIPGAAGPGRLFGLPAEAGDIANYVLLPSARTAAHLERILADESPEALARARRRHVAELVGG